MELNWTGERYLPWVGGHNIHYEHLHRYFFASLLVKNKKVLDLASGEGYGSSLLSKTAREVIGLELDGQTVQHAGKKYCSGNLSFLQGDICAVPFKENEYFDVIVCFEAIEHVEKQDKVMQEIKRLLKNDGMLLISSPNRLLHGDDAVRANEFHKKEMYFAEFKGLLEKYFPSVEFFGQQAMAGSVIWPLDNRARETDAAYLTRQDEKYTFWEKPGREPLFFMAVASFSKLNFAKESVLLDAEYNADYMEEQKERLKTAEEQLKAVKESTSWKITAPLRLLRNFFKSAKRS